MWKILGSSLLATAAALHGYHTLTGRDALLDLRDKVRLQSRSLADWDNFCAANPKRSEIVVCLTTTPSRISRIEGTLKSLFYQTHRPKTIRLHVPTFSRREGRLYSVPAALQTLTALEIVRCADAGPATKLLPALEVFDREQPLLVVDDDRLYPPDLIERFTDAAALLPHAALGLSGWNVPDTLIDRPTTLLDHLCQRAPAPVKSTRLHQPRRVDILMGYTGYLVRPAFFEHTTVSDYSAAPPAAFYVDDVWISAHCTAPRWVFPAPRHCFIPRKDWFLHDRTALYRLNNGGGNPELRNNTLLIRYFQDRWLCTQ